MLLITIIKCIVLKKREKENKRGKKKKKKNNNNNGPRQIRLKAGVRRYCTLQLNDTIENEDLGERQTHNVGKGKVCIRAK